MAEEDELKTITGEESLGNFMELVQKLKAEPWTSRLNDILDSFEDFLTIRPEPPQSWQDNYATSGKKFDYYQIVLPDAELDRDLIHIENSSAVRVRGDLPDDILFEEFQAVVYRSDSVKNRIPYKLNIGFGWGNVGTSGFKVFDIAFDENDQANEIVFYRNGVPYQTVNIEYATKGGYVLGVKAFLNKDS